MENINERYWAQKLHKDLMRHWKAAVCQTARELQDLLQAKDACVTTQELFINAGLWDQPHDSDNIGDDTADTLTSHLICRSTQR